MSANGWTKGEMLAVAAAHTIRNGDLVAVGLGLPQIAASLAKLTHAPNSALVLEIGAMDVRVEAPAMGVADPRMWHGARSFGGMLDVLGYLVHGARVDVGMLGALQVDPYGSINSTLVRAQDDSQRRFLGSGGANDIASGARRLVIVVRHEKRKFREVVDFITSPGHRVRGRPREELGLPRSAPTIIVTDRAVFQADPSGCTLIALHAGEQLEEVKAATPMPVRVPSPVVPVTDPPSEQELTIIRQMLDPYGWYTR